MTGRDAPGTHDAPGEQSDFDLERVATNQLDPMDLLSSEQALRLLEAESHVAEMPGDADGVPRITRMPAGMEVVEHAIGHAVAQWILQVHCDCGKRWFELAEVKFCKCPRCGLLVHVEVDVSGAPSPPKY